MKRRKLVFFRSSKQISATRNYSFLLLNFLSPNFYWVSWSVEFIELIEFIIDFVGIFFVYSLHSPRILFAFSYNLKTSRLPNGQEENLVLGMCKCKIFIENFSFKFLKKFLLAFYDIFLKISRNVFRLFVLSVLLAFYKSRLVEF